MHVKGEGLNIKSKNLKTRANPKFKVHISGISVGGFKYQLHYFADSKDNSAIPDCPHETFSLSHICHKSKMCPGDKRPKLSLSSENGIRCVFWGSNDNSFDKLSNDTIIQKKGVSEPIGITKHKIT